MGVDGRNKSQRLLPPNPFESVDKFIKRLKPVRCLTGFNLFIKGYSFLFWFFRIRLLLLLNPITLSVEFKISSTYFMIQYDK